MVASVEHKAVLDIRRMKLGDIPIVVKIEKECFPQFRWTKETFIQCFNSGCTCLVGIVADEIIAYMIYNIGHKFAHLENIAVAPKAQRQGFGRQLIARFTKKLSAHRPEISLEVRATNKNAQLFFKEIFKEIGLVKVLIIPKFYEDTAEDAYLMLCLHNSRNLGPLPPEIVARL